MRKPSRFTLLGVAVCVFAVGLLAGCKSEEKTAAFPPPLVEVMTVQARDVPVTNTFVGQTEGSRAVEVRAQVSGILMRRAYDEGQYVEKGQLLFEIEPDTYRAALEQTRGALAQAQAKLTQAKQDLNRIRPLYAQNAVSQKDRDDAQATYNSAQADVDSAKAAMHEAEIKLGYAYVRAPVSGFTGQEKLTVGNLISAGSQTGSLLTVVNQLDPIYANFSIPSPQLMRMRALEDQGRLRTETVVAEIALADGTPYKRTGVVNFLDKQVNPGTSVVAARAEFANPDFYVFPGQFVRVTISGLTLVKAILVPQKAIIQTQKGSMVAVIGKDDKAEMRLVDFSDNYGDSFLVNAGLESGERIVVEGGNKVVPGAPVRIKPSQQETPAPLADQPVTAGTSGKAE